MSQNIDCIGRFAGPYITDPFMLGIYRYGIDTETDLWLLTENDYPIFRT